MVEVHACRLDLDRELRQHLQIKRTCNELLAERVQIQCTDANVPHTWPIHYRSQAVKPCIASHVAELAREDVGHRAEGWLSR